jgi:hypothetical protein
VENAAYGDTICAERTAVVKAVSEGHRDDLSASPSPDIPPTTAPCGSCRQVLFEFAPNLEVLIARRARLREAVPAGAACPRLWPQGPAVIPLERVLYKAFHFGYLSPDTQNEEVFSMIMDKIALIRPSSAA